MSKNLVKQFPSLQLLCNLKDARLKKRLLKELSENECFCKAVREIAKNTVKGNVKLLENDKKKIRKHQKLIWDIAQKRKGKRKTKELVQQSGTGVVLPILVPIVASLLSDLLSK